MNERADYTTWQIVAAGDRTPHGNATIPLLGRRAAKISNEQRENVEQRLDVVAGAPWAELGPFPVVFLIALRSSFVPAAHSFNVEAEG